jgi:hypothetical protein
MSLFRLTRCAASSSRPHVARNTASRTALLHSPSTKTDASDASNVSHARVTALPPAGDALKPAATKRKRIKKSVLEEQLSGLEDSEDITGLPSYESVLDEIKSKRRPAPTLDELDKLKPESVDTGNIISYKNAQYDPLLDLLSRRFTRDQLRTLVNDSKLKLDGRPTTKEGYAETIMQERWSLHDPAKVQQQREYLRKKVDDCA